MISSPSKGGLFSHLSEAKYTMSIRTAFQGVHGAYSELAARKILGRDLIMIPCETFDLVFAKVTDGSARQGIIPIENSLAGSIHLNYDLLLSHRLYIVGETHLRIEHLLMCHPRSSFRKLTGIRSHPQALAQCSAFFRSHRAIKALPYFDTAGAARSIAEEGCLNIGAIAGGYAAKLYDLKILRSNLENSSRNFTRFLVIGRKPWKPHPGIRTKTSIVFRPSANRPGILFHILGVFALREIDLVKIESRPDPHSPFDYLFYVDLAGGPQEARVARAFEHLKEVVSYFRILGTYAAGQTDFPRQK
jgi:prephenate dehydratase